MKASMAPGPLMIDCAGLELTPEDRDIIAHPLVGGVILFARNFEDPEQVSALCRAIRAVKNQPVLIAVDQEGGRVQRFKHGMTALPAMASLGQLYQQDVSGSLNHARSLGWLLASELIALDVDFSFAPVLDLDYGHSEVIGDRAFAADPQTVSELCEAFQAGVHQAGMATVGKHFPGHGAVAADSHTDIPVDERLMSELNAADLLPFKHLILSGLNAIMPAHVIYPHVDSRPAGFSPVWLQEVLRKAMRFDGVIFSDDLSMAGARVAGDHLDAAHAAIEAGCDMVLICNDRDASIRVLDGLSGYAPNQISSERLMTMCCSPKQAYTLEALMSQPAWLQARTFVDELRALA